MARFLPAMLPRPFVVPLARWHSRRAWVRDVGGAATVVLPGVFDPVLTKVGAWLAGELVGRVRPGERWLEIGTGSGAVACELAQAGARVTATDIDPEAVRNTRLNAALGGVEVGVREGDLFAPVAGERFDVVVANLPFWPGDGDGLPLGRAFAGGEDFALLRRFVAELEGVAPTGYTVLSEAFSAFPEARAALGSGARLVRRARHRGEWMDLFEVGTRRD